MRVNTRLTPRKTRPVIRTHESKLFFFSASLRSRYFAYTSCLLLPIGIKVSITFLRTKPIPSNAPSSDTKSMPAIIVRRIPDTKKPSDNTNKFVPISAEKNPLIANTMSVISDAIPKQTPYLINSDLFSGFTKINRPFLYFKALLYFSSSASLQSTKCPGETSRKEGASTE